MVRPLTTMSSQHSFLITSFRYILARFSNSFSSRIWGKRQKSQYTQTPLQGSNEKDNKVNILKLLFRDIIKKTINSKYTKLLLVTDLRKRTTELKMLKTPLFSQKKSIESKYSKTVLHRPQKKTIKTKHSNSFFSWNMRIKTIRSSTSVSYLYSVSITLQGSDKNLNHKNAVKKKRPNNFVKILFAGKVSSYVCL